MLQWIAPAWREEIQTPLCGTPRPPIPSPAYFSKALCAPKLSHGQCFTGLWVLWLLRCPCLGSSDLLFLKGPSSELFSLFPPIVLTNLSLKTGSVRRPPPLRPFFLLLEFPYRTMTTQRQWPLVNQPSHMAQKRPQLVFKSAKQMKKYVKRSVFEICKTYQVKYMMIPSRGR